MIPVIDIKNEWLERMVQTGQASAGEVRAMAHELLQKRKEAMAPPPPAPIDWGFCP